LSLEQFMTTDVELLDKDCFDTVDTNVNMLVPWYLMAAYAYYVEDDPILSDATYDNLVKKLLDRWDEVEHRHKPLIDRDQLLAGTFLGQYPSIIKGAVRDLRENVKKR
jgi:hypothetical protein